MIRAEIVASIKMNNVVEIAWPRAPGSAIGACHAPMATIPMHEFRHVARYGVCRAPRSLAQLPPAGMGARCDPAPAARSRRGRHGQGAHSQPREQRVDQRQGGDCQRRCIHTVLHKSGIRPRRFCCPRNVRRAAAEPLARVAPARFLEALPRAFEIALQRDRQFREPWRDSPASVGQRLGQSGQA